MESMESTHVHWSPWDWKRKHFIAEFTALGKRVPTFYHPFALPSGLQEIGNQKIPKERQSTFLQWQTVRLVAYQERDQDFQTISFVPDQLINFDPGQKPNADRTQSLHDSQLHVPTAATQGQLIFAKKAPRSPLG